MPKTLLAQLVLLAGAPVSPAGPPQGVSGRMVLSVWRTGWQQGRSALDFLSRFLRGLPSQDRAIFGRNVWPTDTVGASELRDRQPC
jgi:hypothetical protein